jgi:hypothetical protein
MSKLASYTMAAALAAALIPSAAQAGTCEETFVKKGNGITGLRFIAMTSVPDMPVDVAINQLRGIVAKRGYDIIAVEPQAGGMLIEQSQTGTTRAFPIEVNATVANGAGTVQMEAKLRAGQFVKADFAKTEMCAVLAELKGGKAGKLAATAGAKALTQQAAPIPMSAQAFSQQISKDAERNSLAIAQRYVGKKYTLNGTVDYITRDGQYNRVAFKIQQPHEMAIRLPNMAKSLWNVSCLMGQGTSIYAMQLKPGKSLKLTGTFHEFAEDRNVVWFKDCVPEK